MQKDTLQIEEKSSLDTATKQIHVADAQISQVKTMRLVGLRGNIQILPEPFIDELVREFDIYSVCDRHKIAFLTKKAYKLHFQEEHAY
ncbi:MAG: hypothetical protein ACE5J2_08790 [Nitrososphaerales archaeon]